MLPAAASVSIVVAAARSTVLKAAFVFVVNTEPASVTEPGAVATRPPVNVVLSLDASPSVKLPVLLNVVAPAILFVPPVIDTL